MNKKISHDLAVTYAKSKLDYCVEHDMLPSQKFPRSMIETDFMLDTYLSAYEHFRNIQPDKSENELYCSDFPDDTTE